MSVPIPQPTPQGSAEKFEKKKRRISWREYFRLDFNSIQGLITLAFVTNTICFLSIVFYLNYSQKQIQAQRNLLYQASKPMIYHATNILAAVRQTKVHLSQFIILNEPTNRSKLKENWLIVIPAYKDSLLHFTNQLNDLDAKVGYNNITRQLVEIRQIQQQIEVRFATQKNFNAVRKLYTNDLSSAENILEQNIRNFINQIKLKEIALEKHTTETELWINRFTIWAVIIALVLTYSVGILVFTRSFSWLRFIQSKMQEIARGNLIEPLPHRRDEFRGIARSLNELTANLAAVKEYANQVGKGNFETQLAVFEQDSDLGKALNEMRRSLLEVYQEEQRRIWFTNGLAKFSDILRDNSANLDKLCRELITNLVKQVEVVQGGIFILNEQTPEPVLELKAAYAYGREKFIQRTLTTTEGLIGRAFQEKETLYFTDIPKNYMYITSGLGNTEPTHLLIVPLENEEHKIKGVIELASLKPFAEYHIRFVKALAQNVASAITVVSTNQQNQKLLKDYQEANIRFQQQEQKLVQINQELREDNERILAKMREAEKEYEKLLRVLELINDSVVISDSLGIIQYFNKASERLFGFTADEVLGRNVKMLMPPPDRDNHHLYIARYLNEQEKRVLGTSRQVEGLSKDGTIIPLFLKLGEVIVRDEVFFVAVFRKIQTF
ncbi:MAG: PAS domain S-box protein [Microscillaceae bacterium]|nr:PAS domain S-box protein [Microscillaceae bacterium]MDW8460719.1 PAS domain S-box protein [Cytophagales bacterium]